MIASLRSCITFSQTAYVLETVSIRRNANASAPLVVFSVGSDPVPAGMPLGVSVPAPCLWDHVFKTVCGYVYSQVFRIHNWGSPPKISASLAVRSLGTAFQKQQSLRAPASSFRLLLSFHYPPPRRTWPHAFASYLPLDKHLSYQSLCLYLLEYAMCFQHFMTFFKHNSWPTLGFATLGVAENSHLIIKYLGLEGTLNPIQSQPLAMVVLHQIRLSRPVSNLPLSIRERESTASSASTSPPSE